MALEIGSCPMCFTTMENWNCGRKQLHLNACCELAVNMRQFASNLNHYSDSQLYHVPCVSQNVYQTITQLKQQSTRPDPSSIRMGELCHSHVILCFSKVDENLQTAMALSLSVCEEDKRRVALSKLGSKIRPTDLGPPSYLLLTKEQRQNIFSDRLATILLQIKKCTVSYPLNSENALQSPNLWSLAVGTNTTINRGEDASEPFLSTYYVPALVPPLSPTKCVWGTNLLSVSQLPGRSATKTQKATPMSVSQCDQSIVLNELDMNQSQGFIPNDWAETDLTPTRSLDHTTDVSPTKSDGSFDNPPSELPSTHPFTRMVGLSTCSDANFQLDDGQCIPVHRFVFAAWGLLTVVFPDDSTTAVIHGIDAVDLFCLLGILYSGDLNNLKEEWSAFSPATQQLIGRWGLPIPTPPQSPANTVSSSPSRSVSNITDTVFTSLSSPHPMKAEGSTPQCAIQMGSPIFSNVKTPSKENPLTPPIHMAQFSRDLFSSPDDSIIVRETNPIVQNQPHPTEPTSPIRTMIDLKTPAPFIASTSTKSSSPKALQLFDDHPTPCPLFQRLRLHVAQPDGQNQSPPSVQHHSLSPKSSPPSPKAEPMQPPILPLVEPTSTQQIPVMHGAESSWHTPIRVRQTTTDESVTPLPDYHGMMTPELRQALSIYGVRPLPRKRAVLLLKEIYKQLHEYHIAGSPSYQNSRAKISPSGKHCPDDVPIRQVRKRPSSGHSNAPRTASPDNPIASSTADSPTQQAGRRSLSMFEIDDTEDQGASAPEGQVELKTTVLNFIRSDENLYRNILLYTPIEFDTLHRTLKDNGLRIGAQKLMDILDEQCITFTLRNRVRQKSQHRSTRVIRAKRAR